MKAHTFSVEQEAGIFKVTVVEMPGEETGEEAPVVKDAAKNVAEGGVIKFDFPHSVGAIYGANSASLGQTGLFLRGAVFTRSRGKLWSLMPCASTNRSISPDFLHQAEPAAAHARARRLADLARSYSSPKSGTL